MTKKVKSILSNVFVVAAIVLALGYVVSRFVHFGRVEFTDNAQVRRHISPLNSRVQGYVKEVRFEDFQHVRKGDTLVVIDNTDFLLQLAQSEAAVIAYLQNKVGYIGGNADCFVGLGYSPLSPSAALMSKVLKIPFSIIR